MPRIGFLSFVASIVLLSALARTAAADSYAVPYCPGLGPDAPDFDPCPGVPMASSQPVFASPAQGGPNPLDPLDPRWAYAWPLNGGTMRGSDAIAAQFTYPPYLTIQNPIQKQDSTFEIPVVVAWRTPGTANPPQRGKLVYTAAVPPDFAMNPRVQASCDVSDATKATELGDTYTSPPAYQHSVRLKLAPDTRYFYRAVLCDGASVGNFMDGSFRTPPAPGGQSEAIRFAHLGEFHAKGGDLSASSGIHEFADEMQQFRPDFVVDSGDMLDATVLPDLESYMRPSRGWLPNAFLLPTYSNHWVWRKSANSWENEIKIHNFFTLPDIHYDSGTPDKHNHKPWYRTRYGNVEIFTLANPPLDKLSTSEATEQTQWLSCALQGMAFDGTSCTPGDGFARAAFRIFAFHEPFDGADLPSPPATPPSSHPFLSTIVQNGGGDLFLVGHEMANIQSYYGNAPTLQIESSVNQSQSSYGDAGHPLCRPTSAEKGPRFLEVAVDVTPGVSCGGMVTAKATLSANYRDEMGHPMCCLRIVKCLSGSTWISDKQGPPVYDTDKSCMTMLSAIPPR